MYVWMVFPIYVHNTNMANFCFKIALKLHFVSTSIRNEIKILHTA